MSEPGQVYMDGYMRQNLDIAKERVKKKWDLISLYVGEEGDGKTTIALQHAYYLDPTISIDRIVFNPMQFEEAVDKAQPFQAIVYDEADDLSGHWANRLLLAIKKKFKRIRSKQLYIFLVTPTMFDLSKYFVIARTTYLVSVYTDGLTRGFFKFYGKKAKRLLYIKGKIEWNMDAWHPDFRGRFANLPDWFPINMVDYEKKKEAAGADILSFEERRVGIRMGEVAIRMQMEGFDNERIAYFLGVSVRRIQQLRKEVKVLKGGESISGVTKGVMTTPNLGEGEEVLVE